MSIKREVYFRDVLSLLNQLPNLNNKLSFSCTKKSRRNCFSHTSFSIRSTDHRQSLIEYFKNHKETKITKIKKTNVEIFDEFFYIDFNPDPDELFCWN